MTAQEHLDWAKDRAREYVDMGSVPDALASMLSDLAKHPGTSALIRSEHARQGVLLVHRRDEVRRWIAGFNLLMLEGHGANSNA